MSSSAHVNNKRNDILIPGKVPTDGLDDTTLTEKKDSSVYLTKHNKKHFSNLCYDGANIYIFVNGFKIHQFKAKDYEIKATPLRLGNFSNFFSVDNMKKVVFMNMYMILVLIMILLLLMIY